MGRIENHGPFHFFFTLSCADLLFSENFVSHLEDFSVEYKFSQGKEFVYVNGKPLEEFMKNNIDIYEFIKKNFVNTTLNFQHRLKNFIKHIVMGPSSELKIKYYGYKVRNCIKISFKASFLNCSYVKCFADIKVFISKRLLIEKYSMVKFSTYLWLLDIKIKYAISKV